VKKETNRETDKEKKKRKKSREKRKKERSCGKKQRENQLLQAEKRQKTNKGNMNLRKPNWPLSTNLNGLSILFNNVKRRSAKNTEAN